MPFDSTKPATNSPLASAAMRAQLNALNEEIQVRTTQTDVTTAIAAAVAGTSANSNSVATISQSADGTYNPSQMQDVLNKLDELISALRR